MRTFVIGDVHGRCAQMEILLDLIPRDTELDTLVLLGDLIDRGPNVPGTVQSVVELKRNSNGNVLCLRGNHEQMLLDFIDRGAGLWLTHFTGSEHTFEQYTNTRLNAETEEAFETMRSEIRSKIPAEHLEFFRSMPLFHEDDYAIYVHAGLSLGKNPSETDADVLLWARDMNFFTHYSGKPCFFGHTPTNHLPLLGRIGRHGIYISQSAIGIDTGFNQSAPLSCIQLPEFILYQAYIDGSVETHHITTLVPDAIRKLQEVAATSAAQA